jgi:hypothetical protein
MYYILSVNVPLCYVSCVYLCLLCGVLVSFPVYFFSLFVVIVNVLCCSFRFFKKSGEGVLLSDVEFVCYVQ